MTTILTYIVAFFSMIGIAVVIVFAIEAISKKADASKEYRKKRIDNLEKINEKLDDIIHILRR
ncbi:MAG: hypothetical protein K2N80_12490 [Lachnospiraceae bacterium]|nr:hypothetical protein [Lachnospiraceae bacterium]